MADMAGLPRLPAAAFGGGRVRRLPLACAMLTQDEMQALAAIARDLPQVDRACYRKYGRDPQQPLVGLGPAAAPLCILGRDPGQVEVQQWLPFVGASGQKIRRVLAGRAGTAGGYTEADGIAAGQPFFWMNTVPYKPVDNKPWPLAVRRRFHAVLLPLLASHWQGRDVLTLGRQAFDWFGLNQPKAVQQRLDTFWSLPDEEKFGTALELELHCGERTRAFTLHPLPHPSPANARWARHFEGLLRSRLARLLPPAP
jgi:uracil-DNA glycosylase